MSRYQRVSETPAGAGAEAGAGMPTPPPPPPVVVPIEPPPPYEAAEATGGAPVPPPPPPPPPPAADKAVRFDLPPAYDAATNPTKLPSYDEVQQEKAREGGPPPPSDPLADDLDEERASALHLWRISSVGMDPEAAAALHDQQLLGTDLMFFTAFLAAFLFNWIGFLLLLCFCHSVAGRYGALAGFGLSLAKWTLIVKNSTTLVSHDNSWLWWLIMAFGLVISVRAILQYLYIKREWRLLPTSARQRLIFFY